MHKNTCIEKKSNTHKQKQAAKKAIEQALADTETSIPAATHALSQATVTTLARAQGADDKIVVVAAASALANSEGDARMMT